MSKSFQINIPITKIDEEQRIVTGIATTEALDSQGDIVDYDASKKAFSEWKGNIREMHDPVAIGKAIDVQCDDKAKTVTVSAKISESADGENAWIKVKEGVLSGFSIGGRVFEVAKDKAVEGANRVLDYALSELSLVDNPANPEAELLMVKSVGGGRLQRVEETHNVKYPAQAWWAAKFLSPDLQKSGVAVKDGDARNEKAASVTTVVNGAAPTQAGTIVPKKVVGVDGKSYTNKSVYDAQEALGIAAQLTYLIMVESQEGEADQAADLVAAFNALRDFAAKEVAEGDDFDWMQGYNEVVELANKAINLRKGKNMSDKKVEKTNVVGGEERNLDAQVTETAEQSGRPVNDTTERAAEAGEQAPGEVVTDKKGEPETDDQGNVVTAGPVYADDDKTKTIDDTARNDSTPPEDKEVVSDKDVSDATNSGTTDTDKTDETTDDKGKVTEEKSDNSTNLLKSIQESLTKLTDVDQGSELKKMADNFTKFSDKVEKSIDSLKDRITTLEKQPVPTKAKASYHVVGKGDSETDTDIKELQKRQDYLAQNPQEAAPGEMESLYKSIRAAGVGEQIKVN